MAKFVLRLTVVIILTTIPAFSMPEVSKMKKTFVDTSALATKSMRFRENSKFLDVPIEDLKRWNETVAVLKSENQATGLNDIESDDDDLEQKVIGGRDARKREFPWMVSLHYQGRFICSAFLISPKIVMTAAHCVVLQNTLQPATAFEGIVGNIARDGPEKKISFREVAAHPRYGENSEFDIAVFRTAEPVEINDAVQTVCLPKAGKQFDEPMAQAMGWGVYRKVGSRAPADTLQTATLPVPSVAMCRRVYRFLATSITDKHVCAGGLDSGICFGVRHSGTDEIRLIETRGTQHLIPKGDSGGPLVSMNGKSKPVAVGVASFVSFLGCARPFIPAVYTSTSSYTDWLSETVRNTTDICFV